MDSLPFQLYVGTEGDLYGGCFHSLLLLCKYPGGLSPGQGITAERCNMSCPPNGGEGEGGGGDGGSQWRVRIGETERNERGKAARQVIPP